MAITALAIQEHGPSSVCVCLPSSMNHQKGLLPRSDEGARCCPVARSRSCDLGGSGGVPLPELPLHLRQLHLPSKARVPPDICNPSSRIRPTLQVEHVQD
jgi:hypothetical protein